MTNCTSNKFYFPVLKRRVIEASFSGGEVTSDGGALLLREVDRILCLTKALNEVMPDPRKPEFVEHSQLSLLRQRVYGIALGYEDLNDHNTLRTDPVLQTAVERNNPLGSSSTLCRLENRSNREVAVEMNRVWVETFIKSFKRAPKELILDFDATNDEIHGEQEGRYYHGYYEQYCFLPLYVFCEGQLLVSYLRRSDRDAAKHAWGILALLVKRFRQKWPRVRIIFRGDSGFCRHRMLSWCERHNVGYITGIGKNNRLLAETKELREKAELTYQRTQEKQRLFGEVSYAAQTWKTPRRVVVKAEHTEQGANPRFVVTNLEGDPKALYETVYCARGEMENRIKEQQLDMFADRTSCHEWWANQFRLLLSSAAYVLVSGIRRLGLKGTELARAQCGTIRLKCFKIGAVIIRNSRRVKILLSSNYPYQNLFIRLAARLSAG